jgi:hypothetical protein
VDPLSSNQIHDYEPGISPTGVFWTVPVPKDAVQVHQGAGRAVLEMTDMPIQDFFNFPNSVSHAIPPEDALVSFRVEWNVEGPWRTVDNPTEAFRFRFRESTDANGASIVWSAQNLGASGFSFQSDPAADSTNVYANLGRERNGVFYQQG